MSVNITQFVKSLKTSALVDLYNLAAEPKVKKFSDRKTAETRVTHLLAASPDYVEFYRKYAVPAKAIHINLPYINVPVSVPANQKPAVPAVNPLHPNETAEERKARYKRELEKATKLGTPVMSEASGAKKQSTPPHINLRCPVLGCGYYAKTTPMWHAKARLVCPIARHHGALLTADERGEKRGCK